MGETSESLRSPEGIQYSATIESARGVTWWVSTPKRLWNTVTRNEAWWLTLHHERFAWPVLKEAFQSEPLAEARLVELARQIESGTVRLERPVLRRQRR